MLSRTFIVLLILVSTSACVPIWQTKQTTTSPESLYQIRYQALSQLDRWIIKGRTVITQDKEGWNVGLYWQQDRGDYQIKLEGPFAQGGVTLEGSEEHVVLTLNNGDKLTAATPEALISQAVGWNLPVSALRDWVRGIPNRGQSFESVTYDDEGRITRLVQQGWEVEYLRYMPFKTYSMPSKIFIRHPELNLRLVIMSWRDVK